MNKIKEYIQFGIDNGFDFKLRFEVIEKNIDLEKICFIGEFNYSKRGRELVSRENSIFSTLEIITSKEFIESIARGILKKFKWDKEDEIYYTGVINNKDRTYMSLEELIDEITYEQAIAIRENELEDFITNFGIGTK